MRENRLLIGWACVKIGYSLVEHLRKLVTCWLSLRESWLLIGWASAKIGYSLAEHAQKMVTKERSQVTWNIPWLCLYVHDKAFAILKVWTNVDTKYMDKLQCLPPRSPEEKEGSLSCLLIFHLLPTIYLINKPSANISQRQLSLQVTLNYHTHFYKPTQGPYDKYEKSPSHW